MLDLSVAERVSHNLNAIRERVARAAVAAGRDPASVTIVGAVKTVPVDALVAAYHVGLRDFGENRVQDAEEKWAGLEAMGLHPTWHMIGHLQTNKVRPALKIFRVIQSVDSVRLGESIARRAEAPVPVLLEVNIDGEPTKFGFPPEEVQGAYSRLRDLPDLDIIGLMTVAPMTDDPEAVRPVFRRLRELRDELGLKELSMGMTDDFEVAVQEGATIVRIGRAIFGSRPSP